jgi:DNA polymerase elongation subunit (family B)
MSTHPGWILDVYPVSTGMAVWMIDAGGRSFSFVDPWAPCFYLSGPSNGDRLRESLEKALRSFSVSFEIGATEKKEFFTGRTKRVMAVRVANPLKFARVVERLLRLVSLDFPLELFNADLNLGQAYFYERGLFPLARCRVEIDGENRARSWRLDDSPWDVHYALPPLRYARLGVEPAARGGNEPGSADSPVDPNHRRRGCFLLTLGPEAGCGRTYALDESEEELIRSLGRHLDGWDPDVILTEWGDSYILPRLERHAARTGQALCLSRAPRPPRLEGKNHSFFSYGRMVYKAGARTLFGRIHIDLRNSFTVGHTQLDGLFEIARVAKIPLQRAARCTIGTSLSSLQHEWAIRNNFLIPLDKGQTEDFRPGDALIAADRGGLVY